MARSKRDKPRVPARRPPLSKGRRRLFLFIVTVVMPIAAFVFVELFLRVAGYGVSPDFLIPGRTGTREVLISNAHYGRHYFPKAGARAPADIVLDKVKPTDNYRVFVLGESAAMGDPEISFGLPRVLETLLSEALPGKKVEVINAAMTGINSHVVQEIAADCARYEPDLFVVFMGNNEAIGPYGPGTVFSPFTTHLGLIRFSMWFNKLRVAQLLRNAMSAARKDTQQMWAGLRVFLDKQLHPLDPRIEIMRSHFRQNIERIAGLGKRTIICTVPTNVRDCPPFASLSASSLTKDMKQQCDDLLSSGTELQHAGKLAEALPFFEKAIGIDRTRAEALYRAGMCCEASKEPARALEFCAEARDMDALCFRTTSQANEIIREVAGGSPDFVDAEKLFQSATDGFAPGDDLFVDHVHMTFHANYALAAAICCNAAKLERAPLSEKECADRLGHTPWSEFKITNEILSRFKKPPYTNQIGNSEKVRSVQRRLDELTTYSLAAGLKSLAPAYARAVERNPDDWVLREDYAEVLRNCGALEEEEKHRRILLGLFPDHPARMTHLAQNLGGQKKTAEAMVLCERALKIDASGATYNVMGTAMEAAGKRDEAIRHYRKSIELSPQMQEARFNLTRLLAQGGSADEAIANYEKVIRENPNDAGAHYELGVLRAKKRELAKAAESFATASRLDPSDASAAYNLALLNVEFGKGDEAIGNLKRALSLNETHTSACEKLAELLADKGDAEEATKYYERAASLQPGNSDFQFKLAALSELRNDFANAATYYRAVLKLKPNRPEAENGLAWCLAVKADSTPEEAAEALMLAESACRSTNHEDASMLDTLAASYAAAGRFAEAATAAEKALTLSRGGSDENLTKDMASRLELYRKNEKYRPLPAAGTP